VTSRARFPSRKPRFERGEWVQTRDSEVGTIEEVHAAGDGFRYDVCVGRCFRDDVPEDHLTFLAAE
jgi:hypothetical protein